MCGLQLGFLSTYLSEPIVKAFTSAAAFHVTVSQLQSMLGLRLPRRTGTFSLFKVSSSSAKTTKRFEVLLVFSSFLVPDFRLSDGELGPHQHGRAAHLSGVSGGAGAGEGGQFTLPAAAAHTHSSGDTHCESIWENIWQTFETLERLEGLKSSVNSCLFLFQLTFLNDY